MINREQFKGPMKTIYRNEACNCGETRALSPSKSPHSKQWSSQFPVHLMLLAARSNHFPQTPWCQLQSVQATQPTSKLSFLLRFRLRFLSFFKGALLLNFNSLVERELLIMGVQRLEDIFSIISTNLRNWLNILGLGANDVSAERRKSGDDCKTWLL
jgi:hypothetical protein